MSEDPTQSLILSKLDELIGRVAAVESHVASIDTRLEAVETKVASVDTRLEAVEAKVASVDTRLEIVESKAYDTKPIWERALAELLEVNRTLHSLDRRFSVLNDDVVRVRADQRTLEDRLSELDRPKS